MAPPDDVPWLHNLAGLDACAVLPLFGTEWCRLGDLVRELARSDVAASVLASLVNAAPILTGEPQLYKPLGDDPPIIRI